MATSEATAQTERERDDWKALAEMFERRLTEMHDKFRALARRLDDDGVLAASTITDVLDGTYDPREG